MHVRTFVVSPIGSNCYVVTEQDALGAKAVIVDPGDPQLDPVFEYIEDRGFQVEAIWCTHGHFDHMLGVDVAREKYRVPVFCHKADLPVWDTAAEVTAQWLGRVVPVVAHPDHFWDEGDVVTLGASKWKIMHTPGHSPGSVCIVGEDVTFTGDTLFAGSIGRTDFPLSSPTDMQTSLQKVLTLPDEMVIRPGHGGVSSIGVERRTNPFLV